MEFCTVTLCRLTRCFESRVDKITSHIWPRRANKKDFLILIKFNASAICLILNLLYVFFCSGTDISATVPPIIVKFCMTVHIPDALSPPFGGRWYPQGSSKSQNFGLNSGHLTANISKTLSRRWTRKYRNKIKDKNVYCIYPYWPEA